ncbi:MAG: NUDIX hydrolase, partial [Candidatus Micrarchaeota archaeon]|nr:NUDIX hydrolase [Candidatus Micrarchaeota archaeon]
ELVECVRPVSVYVYGSWIDSESDMSILLGVNEEHLNFKWLKSFAERYGLLDITVLTQDEIKTGVFSPFVFMLFSSIRVYGKDLLKEFTEFPDFASALRRVRCILQRIRNILSKSNEESYWLEKFTHWLYLVISEFLFFTKGYFNPNLLQTKNKFEDEFFELNINNLEDLYDVFSRIKELYLNHPHQHIRIRPGIFVLIRDKAGRYLMLERSDGRGFEFIKGGVELGESFEDAALREIEEEIGIKASPRELIELPVALSFQFPLKEGCETRIYKGFLIIRDNIDVDTLKLDKFFSSAKLMKLDELSKFVSFPDYYETIKKADELLRKKIDLVLDINEIKKSKKCKKSNKTLTFLVISKYAL